MQKSQAAPTVLQDPKDGASLSAPAGGTAEVHFRCDNPGNPNVAFFTARLEGLPDVAWAKSPERGVAPEGQEVLAVTLTPPYEAAEGDYEFQVQLLMDGSIFAPALRLTLQVVGFLTPPVIDPAVAEQNAQRQEAEARRQEQAREEDERRREQERLRLEDERRRAEERLRQEAAVRDQQTRAQQDEATRAMDARTQQETAAREQQARTQQDEEAVRRERERVQADLQRRRAEQTRQEEERRLAEQARREEELRKQEEAKRLADQTPRLEELPQAGNGGPEAGVDEQEASPPPNSIEDPPDGTVMALRPGDTILVRFLITNDATTTTTYIIDHDHTPLIEEWIELSPDQINLPRNGKGELGFRLTPPLNARPGEYSFAVSYGRIGAAQTIRGLVLSVLPTPAVKLTTAVPAVKVGPFPGNVDFELKVSGDGNADTAFRISAKEPLVAVGAAAKHGPDTLYETPEWRYLFNKEVDNVGVEQHSPNPKQATIQLRLQRKGIWWFGFQERHKVRVSAVPVTDPDNCGKTANVVELLATRWRLLPFPGMVLLPLLLLLFLLFSGGASELQVSKSDYQDKDDTYYIVDRRADKALPMKIPLEWEASPWNILLLHGGIAGAKAPLINQAALGSGDAAVNVRFDANFPQYEFFVNRIWGGGAVRRVKVNLVQTYDARQLKLTAQTGGSTVPLEPNDKGEITLRVPPSGLVHLNLMNSSAVDVDVQYKRIKALSDASPFMFDYALDDAGSVQWKQTKSITLKMNPRGASTGPGSTDNEFIMVTTSARMPLLRFKLAPGQ